MAEAEAMYLRALQGKEKAWGAEHTSTLDTVNSLHTFLWRDSPPQILVIHPKGRGCHE
jgi:hypothetical protein